MSGSPQSEKELAAYFATQAARRQEYEAEFRASGDWDKLLGFADSQNRAAVLVEALDHCTEADERTSLLAEWFNSCDALAPQREQLRAHLEQTTFFTDEEGAASVPNFPVTVYRGAWDDDETDLALSWTTDLTFAERFARGLVGARARLILGMYREEGTPTIYRGTCVEAYGYLNSRGEHEVIAKKVRAVRPISQLVDADA